MKGVILAGGKGTRLLPATRVSNKHLISILNRPMILYPIETLQHLGIENVCLVSGGEHIGGFAEFLGDGLEYGIDLTYRVQREAGGIAHALLYAEEFCRGQEVTVILGDNIFENIGLKLPDHKEAHLYLKRVDDASRFGVAEVWGADILSIEEKPKKPKSSFAVTGLYKYPPDVFEIIKALKPSKRGELEITDVNTRYVRERRCQFSTVTGFWSDAGTPESMWRTTEWLARFRGFS